MTKTTNQLYYVCWQIKDQKGQGTKSLDKKNSTSLGY